jgi:hypothetical protein
LKTVVWATIDTAPKDGSEIMGWHRHMVTSAPFRWNAEKQTWTATHGFADVIRDEPSFHFKTDLNLTHWAPMPSPFRG